MTQQPVWRRIANLGDVSPIEYGGYFIDIDETGVYAAEAELLISPDDDGGTWLVYRFILEPCTFQNGVLSDNKYHPELSAWFAGPDTEKADRPQDTTYLSNVASFTGQNEEQLIAQLISADPIERAHAYRAIGEYHGFENFDQSPLELTKTEVIARYGKEK